MSVTSLRPNMSHWPERVDLAAAIREACELSLVEANMNAAADNAGGGRYRASLAYRRFHGVGGLKIVRRRKSVSDDGGLKRHHRSVRFDRLGHLRRDDKIFLHAASPI